METDKPEGRVIVGPSNDNGDPSAVGEPVLGDGRHGTRDGSKSTVN